MQVPLRFAKFTFHLKALETIELPRYAGSTLRGGLGNAFKKVVCVTRSADCARCLLRKKCLYVYVFETPPPPSSQIMRKYPTAPHPFIIDPPVTKTPVYPPGKEIVFGLTLIGRAIEYLPYFIYTFIKLGELGLGKGRGKFELHKVSDTLNNDTEIFNAHTQTLTAGFKTITADDLNPGPPVSNKITLQFLTPTRIKFNGKYTINLEFHILIRNLLRRIALLSYFHCDQELNVDFNSLIRRAKDVRIAHRNLKWYDWQRYSTRQQRAMKLGGFIGSVTYQTDHPDSFRPFLPYIYVGQFTHLGKASSFGLGKYKITEGKEDGK